MFYVFLFAGSAAAIEFCVLRRWLGRRSLTACVLTASVVNGVFWTAVLFARVSLLYGWKDAGSSLSWGDYIAAAAFFVVVDVIYFSILALIPATLTAALYLRIKSRTQR